MKNNCYVYGHYTADTDELFYVGKGTRRRAWSKSGRSEHWNNKVNKHGLVVKILEEELTDEAAYQRENELITEYRLAGKKLVNICEGGIGMSSADAQRISQDPDWQRKNAERAKRLSQDPEFLRKMAEVGKRLSQDPEWHRKNAEKNKRLSQDPEHRKKMEAIYQDPEYRRNHAEAIKRRSQDPEWHRKQAEQNKLLSQDPEWLRKNAEVAKRNSQNPEFGKKVSEGLKRYHANKKKELQNKEADES